MYLKGLISRFVIVSVLICATNQAALNILNKFSLEDLKSCGLLTGETLTKCLLEPLQKQKCDVGNTVNKYLGAVDRLANKDLTALSDMCDSCAGCKQSKRQCLLSRISMGSLKQCKPLTGLLTGKLGFLSKLR
ncbi:hypothetical protein FGIG_09147 [Fasciola gigantica]|uniref:Saposin B-type domain-containing protein n=1 Tax=Fasciola gigantica TaxID=46835 RepID=A0A504YA52_FASGI|nr:hypothetical protein FGIG_09147 [Fasciola gigantica]